jgi:hypothetical protein
MGLIGLYLLYLSVLSFWFPWQLVLYPPLRIGSFLWKTPFKSHTRQFSFDDVKSINVGMDGDGKDESLLWLVDITFHDKPAWGMGTADDKEVAMEYAGRLAQILGTDVIEKPAD